MWPMQVAEGWLGISRPADVVVFAPHAQATTHTKAAQNLPK
jgi:hypothetical protein